MKYNFTYLNSINEKENKKINAFVKHMQFLQEKKGLITRREKEFKIVEELIKSYGIKTAFHIYTNL